VLEPLFRGTVDLALIAEQWDQLVRIAASLRDRTAPATSSCSGSSTPCPLTRSRM